MSSFDKSIHNIKNMPSWLRTAIMLPPLLLTLYWAYSFSGLYRFYTNIQIYLNDGTYEEAASFALAFFSIMLPATGLLLYVAYKYYPDKSGQTSENPSPKKKTLYQKIGMISNKQSVWFAAYCLFFGIAVLVVAFGGFSFVSNYDVSQTPVNIDINNNTLVTSRKKEFITIKGYPSCAQTFSFFETKEKNSSVESKKTEYYIPLYNEKGIFSYIFLLKTIHEKVEPENRSLQKTSSAPKDTFDCLEGLEFSATGIISATRMPGLIRDAYLETGLLKEGDSYSILDLDQVKGPSKIDFSLALIPLACIIILIILEWQLQLFADENFEGDKDNHNPEKMKVPAVLKELFK